MISSAKLQKKIGINKFFRINILQYNYFFITLHKNINIAHYNNINITIYSYNF